MKRMMKRTMIMILLLLAVMGMQAQSQVGNQSNNGGTEVYATQSENVQSDNGDTKVYDTADEMPAFPGGPNGLMQFISSNLHYPLVCEENGIQGRVVCSFVIERDGSVSDVRIIKSVDPSLDKEAIRVVSSMPKWIPGRQNGQMVRVKYNLPVTFRLQ